MRKIDNPSELIELLISVASNPRDALLSLSLNIPIDKVSYLKGINLLECIPRDILPDISANNYSTIKQSLTRLQVEQLGYFLRKGICSVEALPVLVPYPIIKISPPYVVTEDSNNTYVYNPPDIDVVISSLTDEYGLTIARLNEMIDREGRATGSDKQGTQQAIVNWRASWTRLSAARVQIQYVIVQNNFRGLSYSRQRASDLMSGMVYLRDVDSVNKGVLSIVEGARSIYI